MCLVDVCCSLYCDIVVGGEKKKVFWKWLKVNDGFIFINVIDILEEEDLEVDELDGSYDFI